MYIPIDNYFSGAAKDKVILHVSRFTRPTVWADKGHAQMIQAFKRITRKMPDWKLILAGSVDPYMDMYVSDLARLAAGYEVDIMPNLPTQSLVNLYSHSAIYWHATGVSLPHEPSAQEHMGIAPLEAQASGCVPIVFNSGGMPEVIVNKQTGILFDNVDELSEITYELSQNLTAWAQLSQAGYVWTRSWKDLDAFTHRVDEMLNQKPISPAHPFTMDLNNSPTDVTIVIPTYNSPLLQQCLDSLKNTAPITPIIVINNGEPLSNLTVDNNVSVIEVGQNLGFAGAHRLASQMVETPFVLMLNDDVIADKLGWLEQLLFMMNNATTGVVGPKLYFPDGRVQFAGGLIDFNREDIGYHRHYGEQDDLSLSSAVEVDFITGAALLCRKELYYIPDELLGKYNYEDAWLCLRAKEMGYKIVYQPASSMIHHEGETKKRNPEVGAKVSAAREEFVKRWGG